MRLKVLLHDNCFDGAASAALFARFFRQKLQPGAQIEFRGLQHQAGDPFPPDAFDADEHAIVDFRYHQSPRLGWWFDHHVSAFQQPGDEAHFRADGGGRKIYDPTARSCTKLMAEVLSARFGFDAAPHQELIAWADLIDGAQFPDPRTAVELAEPALRLMTWVENNRDPARAAQLIEALEARPLAEIAAQPWVAEPLAPLLAEHRRALEVIRARARLAGGVVAFDVSEDGLESPNKFIPYFLFPECRYVVGVSRSPTRCKVSVGSNPWTPERRTHDIARICERYGGGGHPVVGAVSLRPSELERARTIAREIVEELQGA